MDTVPAEGHWHLGQLESHARYLGLKSNRTMEDKDLDELDSHQLLDELTDAENNLVQN